MKNSPQFALIQGRVNTSTPCNPVTPPPHPMLEGKGWLDVPNGTAYGMFTYAQAREFSSAMFDYKTLCFIPSNGFQAIQLDGLALRLADEALDQTYLLPGMTFFPEDGDGVLLIGYGEKFAEIITEDITASCEQNIAFPIGRMSAKPCRNSRGKNLRNTSMWTPPDKSELEDLKPLAGFLAGLNLSEKNQSDFRAAEIIRAAEQLRKIEENKAFWKAKNVEEKIT